MRIYLPDHVIEALKNLPYGEITKFSKSSGYIVAHCPDHPRSWATGYIYLHRLLAEVKVGRRLVDTEVVHHLNGNKLDNSLENLLITTAIGHAKTHADKVLTTEITLKCPECSKIFKVRKGNCFLHKTQKTKMTCCSRSCRAKITYKIKIGSISDVNLKSLESSNIVKIERRPRSSVDRTSAS